MEEKKYTEEDLKKIILQQRQQIVSLEEKLRTINAVTLRLNFLFKVLEYSGAFSDDFYNKCTQEIESLLTIPEEDSTDEEKE